jgi:hypothetical protein
MSARLIDLNAETYFLANEALAELQELKIPQKKRGRHASDIGKGKHVHCHELRRSTE